MVNSVWASMAGWFTPTGLFCLLNLMIGTIFIISRIKTQNKQQQLGEDNPPQLFRAPSLLERVRSINFSLYRSEHPHPFPLETENTHPQDDQTAYDAQTRNPSEELDHHVTRSKSENCVETPASVPAKMKKSASERSVAASMEEQDEEVVERRRPATVRERKWRVTETEPFGEDHEVDAKADDFINRFRQQLNLQRLDSFRRVKEMLRRGS